MGSDKSGTAVTKDGPAAWLDVELHVRPGSSRTSVGGTHDGRLVVRVSAPAVDGAANAAVLRAVAAAFGVRRNQLELRTGATGRRKIVRLTGDSVALGARRDRLASGTEMVTVRT